MERLLKPVIFLSVAWLAAGADVAFAQDTGAKSNGNWETASIWTGGAVPNSTNNVYIGSTYPSGASATATVTLTASESAARVSLGFINGDSGTLNLGGNALTISGELMIGYGGVGILNEGGGSFTAASVYIEHGSSLTFGSNDAVSYLWLSNASSATTTATGNDTGNIDVVSGSTLTMGANMNLGVTRYLNVQSGSTFNAANHAITAGSIQFGWNGTSAVNLKNLGNLTTTALYVGNGMTFNINAADSVGTFNLSAGSSTLNSSVNDLNLSHSATAATTATGSVTGSVSVASGSTLTAGADLTLTGSLNVQDSGSILNMNGHAINAEAVLFGWNGSSAVTLQNMGNLTTTNLYVGNGMNFNINAADSVTNLNLSTGATVMIMATGSVTGYVGVASGSTLTAGADLTLFNGSNLNVQDSGSILNMNGHAINADSVLFGWFGTSGVTLQNMGNLTTAYLYVGNGMNFNINGADTVTSLNLNGSGSSSTLNNSVTTLNLTNGATATTTATGSATGDVSVASGSTLTAGADLTLLIGSNLSVQGSGSILNMQGHAINADSVLFGWYGTSAITLQNLGNLTTGTLYVGEGTNFNFNAADSVGTLNLSTGATATTAATGNVTDSVTVSFGSTLTAGADLALTGNLNVQDSGSTFNAQDHALTAVSLLVGWNGNSAATVSNLGQVTLDNLFVGNATVGSALTLHGGDVINGLIDLQNGSVLTVQETNGIGLTLNGTSLSSLTIDPSSMDLNFSLGSSPNWDFRWADSAGGGNWISTLEGMIHSGQIVIDSPDGYSVVDQGGYTYIMGGISAIPEPSSLVLTCLGTVGVMVGMMRRRRASRARM